MGPYYQLLNNNNNDDNKQKHIACTLFRRYCASAESPVRVLHIVINTHMMVCVLQCEKRALSLGSKRLVVHASFVF